MSKEDRAFAPAPSAQRPARKRKRPLTTPLRLLVIFAVFALLILIACQIMIFMPGRSYKGELQPLDESGLATAARLRVDVETLGGTIGERNIYFAAALEAAARHIETEFQRAGLIASRENYEATKTNCANLVVNLPGTAADPARAAEIVVIGAHYDSVFGSPGANDNGSGVAALLELARRLAPAPRARTLRLIAFVNEEPPFFQTETMGSLVHARAAAARGEQIVAMISLETLGCYHDAKQTQKYPLTAFNLLYPSAGNFVAFVGNIDSRALVRRSIRTFREHAQFPSEGAAVPGGIPGVGWSDQWAFWQIGVPAIMVTDTAPFRYEHYHDATDTPDRVDCERLARVVDGLEAVVRELIGD